jgi:hypothetical protein
MPQRSENRNLMLRFGLFLLAVATFLWLRDPSRSIIDILIQIGASILPVVAALLVPFGTYLVILLFRRLLPVTRPAPASDTDAEPEDASKWYWIGSGLFFVGWPVGTILSFLFISSLVGWYFRQLPAIYVAPIDNSHWWLTALFTGMVSGMMLSILIVKGILKSRYELLSWHYDQTIGFDNQKAGKLMFAGAFLFLAAMMFVGLSTYTRFTEEGIHTRRSSSLREEFHPYNEVVAVRQVIRADRPREDQIFIVEYVDGTYWRSAPVASGSVPANYLSIMEYVAHKSGQPFVQVVETADE